jgi:hypothetical protein
LEKAHITYLYFILYQIVINIISIIIGAIKHELSCFSNASTITLANYLIIIASYDLIILIIVMIFLKYTDREPETIIYSSLIISLLVIWSMLSCFIIGIGIAELIEQAKICSDEFLFIVIMVIISIITKVIELVGLFIMKCCSIY